MYVGHYSYIRTTHRYSESRYFTVFFFYSNFNGYMFCLVLERLKDYLYFGGDLNAFYLCIYFHRRRSWKYYTKTLQTSGDTILKTRFVIFEILLQVKFYPSLMQFLI